MRKTKAKARPRNAPFLLAAFDVSRVFRLDSDKLSVAAIWRGTKLAQKCRDFRDANSHALLAREKQEERRS